MDVQIEAGSCIHEHDWDCICVRCNADALGVRSQPHELVTLKRHIFHSDNGTSTREHLQEFNAATQPASARGNSAAAAGCRLTPCTGYKNEYASTESSVPLVALMN